MEPKTTINDWKGFCELCNRLEGYEPENDEYKEVIFRGQPNSVSQMELRSSLYRHLKHENIIDGINSIEKELYEKFRDTWFPEEMKSYLDHISFFQLLAVMQHYGIKTRLLDWTRYWKVAAYFATKDNRCEDKDAVVWYIDRTEIENRLKGYCKNYEGLLNSTSIRSLDIPNRLCLQQNDNRCPARYSSNGQQYCNAVFFKPIFRTATDIRMIVQASIFTYCLNANADHIKCIAEILGTNTAKYCGKIIIPAELKRTFRDKLQGLGCQIKPVINEEWCGQLLKTIVDKYKNKVGTN